MSQDKINKTPKILSEAVIGVILTIYGYLFTYLYEVGYCKRFRIPNSLIEVELVDVIRSSIIIFGLAFVLYFIFEILFPSKPYKIFSLKISYPILFPIFMGFLAITIFEFSWQYTIIFVIYLYFLMVYIYIIVPFIASKIAKGNKKQLEDKKENVKKEEWLLTKYWSKLRDPFHILLPVLLLVLYYASYVGSLEAKNQSSFLIIKSKPELVVLRKYSQKLICAPFNRENKEVKNEFYIKSLNQIAEEGFPLINEEIGPLLASKKKEGS